MNRHDQILRDWFASNCHRSADASGLVRLRGLNIIAARSPIGTWTIDTTNTSSSLPINRSPSRQYMPFRSSTLPPPSIERLSRCPVRQARQLQFARPWTTRAKLADYLPHRRTHLVGLDADAPCNPSSERPGTTVHAAATRPLGLPAGRTRCPITPLLEGTFEAHPPAGSCRRPRPSARCSRVLRCSLPQEESRAEMDWAKQQKWTPLPAAMV